MKHIHKPNKTKNHYAGVWRWHFYIGLLLAPFLLILAVTGGIYLFKGDIESVIYSDYYEVEPGEAVHPPSHLTEVALAEIPAGEVVRYRPRDTASRSAEVGISTEEGEVYTVFVDPYQSEVLGMINDENRVMNTIEDLHGELMAGTLGDRLVELAASWTLLLIASGLYLWWPRKKPSIYGTLIPRKTTSKKQLIRDIHVVPAFWISGGLGLFLITGLLWTGFWGNGVQHVATSTGVGYPPSIWVGDPP